MQTFKIYTVGCKVNQYETQQIREQFIRRDFSELKDSQAADYYIINTCTVTSKADRDSRRFIYLAHRQNPQAKIIVTGCYTQLDSDEIAKICGVTQIVKNQDKHRIAALVNGQNELGECGETGISNFSGHTRAFLKIQDGCNNFCSYCKVPLVRGASRSKPLELIIPEARQLVKNGFKEIVLTGICLGAYGCDLNPQINLIEVIRALENIAGLGRVRLSSIESTDITAALIEKMAGSKKLCRHLHIPLQSGDDEILKKMQRRYTRVDYISLIKKIRSQIPEIGLTTDVLVGFPAETEENFQNTVNLIKEIMPLKVHIFPYSRRAGTSAAGLFNGKLSDKLIRERVKYLKDIAEECSQKYKKLFLNKNIEVLVEARVKENPQFWQGYTDTYIKVLIKTNVNLKNLLVRVKLKRLNKDYLEADLD